MCGRFCKNVDAKNFSISITKYMRLCYDEQKARLSAVEAAEASAFDDLQLPITIKCGTCLPRNLLVNLLAITQRLILVGGGLDAYDGEVVKFSLA